MSEELLCLRDGLPFSPLPAPVEGRDPSVPHAPQRRPSLSLDERRLALRNALRYFPKSLHETLAPEFAAELDNYGHIYMYRFRPKYEMHARPIVDYPAKMQEAKAIMLMIQNNLDPRVAQFPHELVTYGGNGSVFGNWAQYHLVMKYLSEMTYEQTLVLYSGHPVGLFPSSKLAPRVVIANGLTVPNYSTRDMYEKMYAQGNTIYGQMTAGSYCYIGPQGIVHGTTLTLLNAGRKYLSSESLSGIVFLTSGLGGMSGAQAKAAVITGAIGIVVEINPVALDKRESQGWIQSSIRDGDMNKLFEKIRQARAEGKPCSIGYLGNVVDVWERLAELDESLVNLGSDQTSLHNPYGGGYYPAGLSFDESNTMMVENLDLFKEKVQESLRRQAAAINVLSEKRGLKFWDYGNSFLLECSRAGADVGTPEKFKYPSYVEDIMGDIFSLGFGPFRWVCTSGKHDDLHTTDKIAQEVIEELMISASENSKKQYKDNHLWISLAEENKLVVGSMARILYSNATGRVRIALAFNKAIRDGVLSAPVVISRDHHDTGGADSPWRETSNIRDGSKFSADMAFHTVIGDSFRGATWVALHNGGGTGWGEAINCGFGMVLDGSEDVDARIKNMLWWDVNGGVARRAWDGHAFANEAIRESMSIDPLLKVTLPVEADVSLLGKTFK